MDAYLPAEDPGRGRVVGRPPSLFKAPSRFDQWGPEDRIVESWLADPGRLIELGRRCVLVMLDQRWLPDPVEDLPLGPLVRRLLVADWLQPTSTTSDSSELPMPPVGVVPVGEPTHGVGAGVDVPLQRPQ